MSVKNRNTYALAGNDGAGSRYDNAVLYLSPQAQWLLFALFFFSTNVRDNILYHFRPVLKGLAGAAYSLIGACHYFVRLILHPCRKCRSICLDRTVRLNCNEAVLRAQTFLLEFDHIHMARIDLGHHHGNIGRPAVSAVIGYYRGLGLCIGLFYRPYLILGHINCGENKINLCSHFFNLINIHNNQFLNSLRHGLFQFPAIAHCFLIGLACASGACCNSGHLKPGVIIKDRDKSLSHHSGCS